ncbi:MAG: carbohydrate binding family 9 domain-containing protein [Acidobacteria bacterium]|nr:carbohydrate binding family 9 domain-containing protein [Acidobacteriota bacterium]
MRQVVCLSFLLAAALPGIASGEPARTLPAIRAEGRLAIDGRLDEPDWQRAPVAAGFTQSEPDAGAPASEQTEVRILYDAETLYIGVHARHRNPAGIIANELRRDFDGTSTDWVAVIVDPFLDRRNGYQFGVNPAGASWDSQKFNEGRERNLSWDGVWEVRTSRDTSGWYAEYAIPFRTLQLPASDPQTWGINFQRHLQGRLENSYWSPVPRQWALDRLSLAGTLEGLQGIGRGANLRVKPYLAARATRSGRADTATGDAGFDLKYGITPGLTADLTVNTDFSQVEADVQQVGATRFSVLFPEKREFFLENSGLFQFGPGTDRGSQISSAPGTSAGGRDNSVLNDLALFFSRRVGLSRDGESVPIAAGARVSGRVGGTGLGALVVQQREAGDEPAARYSVLRLRRHLMAASDLGVMFVEKRSAGAQNRVAGLDLNLRPTRDVTVFAYAARAIDVESHPPAGRQMAARAGLAFNDGRWVGEGSYGVIGAAFVDEAGFVPRAGIERTQFLLGRRFRPSGTSRWLREIYPAVGFTDVRQEGGSFDSRYWERRLVFTLQNGATLEVGDNPNEEDLVVPFVVNRARAVVVPPGRYVFTDRFIAIGSSRARRLFLDARAVSGGYYDGHRNLLQAGVTARANVHLSGSATYSRDDVELPSGSSVTHQLTARGNIGFSSRLFLNGLVQYDSSSRQWNSNLRFNFLYRPLSDVFVVFSDRRAERVTDIGGRSVAIKVTRLLAF